MTLENTMSPFQNKLKKLMDQLVHFTYDSVEKFPKEELYSSRSQLTRAILSIILNYIEGYARRRKKVQLQFFETSYGSLVESRYLYNFALKRKWISKETYTQAMILADEIAKMLWSEIMATEKGIESSG